VDWLALGFSLLFGLFGLACLVLVIPGLPGTWVLLVVAVGVELLDAPVTGGNLTADMTVEPVVRAVVPAPFDGFGVQANMTYLDTEYTVPLGDGTTRSTSFFQQPELVYNLTGFYVTPAFEVRVSYNYTDEFLDALNAGDPNRDEFWDERTQVDMQARFNITPRISVIGEVQNLTDEGRRELTGPGAGFLQEDAEFGRTFWVGVNAEF